MPAAIAQNEVELAKLPIVRIQDVLLSRMVAREEAARLGFTPQALIQIGTAVSEMTRNVVQHAGTAGQIRIWKIAAPGHSGLKIAVEDTGVGIADVPAALAGSSPGSGIPGTRQLMDEFAIRSSAGAGTTVTMVKWL